MAFLSSCWFLVEYVLIPVGDEKWFRLSFFIHPQIFILCQVFSWIRVFGVKMTVEEIIRCEIPETSNSIRTIISRNCYPGVLPNSCKMKSVKVERNWFDVKESIKEESVVHVDKDLSENESSMYLQSSVSQVTGVDAENETDGSDINNFSSCVLSSESHDMEAETETNEKENDQSDPFFAKYIERMKWFDLLNYERTCGTSSILNKQLGTPSSFESKEPRDFSVPFLSWSKMDRRKLIRSLENDFEMVYVGQSCLCWEALHHQYRKVEALACTGSQNGAFYNNVAGEFQKFQVLLERFMENEGIQGKRLWNYVQGRFSLKSLLQVPEVSGYFEGENEAREGEAMGASEVLETIEESIMTFSKFVNTDNKKSWWKFRSYLWSHQPVEDPKDLELSFDLTKRLQKKELYLKDLQRRKKCWLKRAKLVEHNQRREILFSMIDMKLISRVLQMPIISTSQLKWCQEKLNSIEFTEGKVTRVWTNCLFPPS
ncbi:uncharacterized protein LOC122654852 [Telopea speciosissima]|uniref:uncharacterized protein LOC122654852 n=1 Tax=Telopea speciosissima TaxID=54955 RepID=UPI001CC568E8|nr:uncharacterized protein LOC122654852 [Telopea speciosissima]